MYTNNMPTTSKSYMCVHTDTVDYPLTLWAHLLPVRGWRVCCWGGCEGGVGLLQREVGGARGSCGTT